MNYNNLITGLRVQTQIPLDYKGYVQSEAALVDLGNSNNLAYTYHKGLLFFCKNEGTRYEWKEVITGEENTGLRTNDFVYPPNLIVDGVNYSNKRYNFYPVGKIPTLDEVLVAGNSTTHSILFGDGGPINANIGAYQVLIGNGPDNYTLTSSSLSHNYGLDYSRLTLPLNTGAQATFQTPIKPTGTYTLATTADNYWTKTGNNILNNNTGIVILRGGAGGIYDTVLKTQYLNGVTWMDSNFRVDNGGNVEASNVTVTGGVLLPPGGFLACDGDGTNYIKGYRDDRWVSDIKFKYLTDLSATYDDRTLIDKGYLNTRLLSIPLELKDEGNGNGIVITGRDSANYASVGLRAVDLSYTATASLITGASGESSFAANEQTFASAYCSFASGLETVASGVGAHSEGVQSRATGYASHAEGSDTLASGTYAHSEGGTTVAGGDYAHVEGLNSEANGNGSHAEGNACYALGENAHAEGNGTLAAGNNSHTGGMESVARSYGETSVGIHGTDQAGSATTIVSTDRLFNIGNGTSNIAKSDALTVLKNGLTTLPSTTNAMITAASGKAVVTKEYLAAELGAIASGLVVDLHYINSWILDNQYSFATGLAGGKVILSATAFLECTSATQGYIVGDIIPVPSPERNDSGGIPSQGIGVQFSSATNGVIRVITSSEISIMPAYTGASTGSPIILSTPASWKLRIVVMSI